jgi:hypothetical protein
VRLLWVLKGFHISLTAGEKMTSDFVKTFIHEAIAKSLKQGGVTFVEEMAEAMSQDQLEKFIDILKRVSERRKNVINIPRHGR